MLKKIGDSVKSQLDKAKEAVDIVGEKISELKDAGLEKINAGFDELALGLPLIEEAGFKFGEISIDLGIPPDVSVSFTKTNQVDASVIEALINSNQEKKILVVLLKTLLTANNLQGKITSDKFIFSGVSIKLGLPPQVSLHYK